MRTTRISNCRIKKEKSSIFQPKKLLDILKKDNIIESVWGYISILSERDLKGENNE